MKTIIMPRLDWDMKKGKVLEWVKKEGDELKQGEIVVKIMTEKVTYEVPSPASGLLYRIIGPPETDLPVGEVIGVIKEPEDSPSVVDETVKKAETTLMAAKAETRIERKEEITEVGFEVEREKIKISPLARKIAEEMSVDYTKIKGTGPSGRITREDVLKAAELRVRPLEEAEVVPLKGVKKIVAERMVQSFRTAPHAVLMMEVDMSEAVRLRRKFEESRGKTVSYTAILVKAAAKALREYPSVNSTIEGDRIRILRDINVGVAVDTELGLMVPVIPEADKKTLDEVDDTMQELVKKAREGGLSLGEVTRGTFTITNLGMLGVDSFIAIINPGQAAIMATGEMKDKPKVVDGRIEIKPILTLSLSFDHRILDGALAARFLGRVKSILEGNLEEHM